MTPMPSQLPSSFASQITDYELHHRVLDNGLTVVVNPDPQAPGVAVEIRYKVGSSDEAESKTGFAHLFEHLMFAGSAHVESGEHLRLVQSLGGAANATTSFDATRYFETVGNHGLDLALWLEADRMATLNVDQSNLDTQREVVKEEKRERYDNVPYGDHLERLLALNFPADSCYAHPVIGSMKDLDAASLSDVQQFYRRWYQPSNAILVLCGAITPDQGFTLAERYFGSIPSHTDRSDLPVFASLPGHTEPICEVIRARVPQPACGFYWRTPPSTHPDHNTLVVLFTILAGSASSRLVKDLVRTKSTATCVQSSALPLVKGNSVWMVWNHMSSQDSLEEIQHSIAHHLTEIIDNGAGVDEIQRAKAGLTSGHLSTMAVLGSRASTIATHTALFGDPGRVNQVIDELNQVTNADIRRVGAQWCRPEMAAQLRYEVSQ